MKGQWFATKLQSMLLTSIFVHEEGLAEEKTATFLLHKSKHDLAMEHFINAKRCYEAWGARSLVKRVDKAIAILSPSCAGILH